MKKIIGYTILGLCFLSLFIATCVRFGCVKAILAWTVSLVFTGLIVLGVYLIVD